MITCFAFVRVLVAQGLNQTIFPQFPRLTADFAGMEGLLYGGKDALANGVIPTTVHVKAQAAKFLFHLQDFKLASSLLLEFGDQRLQVCAESPNNLEPAIIVSEAQSHSCVAKIALGIEPKRATARPTFAQVPLCICV